MQNALEIIETFLRRGEPEVQGHEVEVPAEVVTRFRKLARAELDRDAIREISETLKENPSWVHRLAAEIREAQAAGND